MIDGITIHQLSKRLVANRVTIEKYIDLEGIQPIRVEGNGRFKIYDEKEVESKLKQHLKPRGTHNTTPNIDPDSGLTWAQKEKREKARQLERENELADKLASEEYMKTADHHRAIAAITNRIEQIPGKAQSELGLTQAQIFGLQRMLDEARTSAAQEMREMEPTE